MSRSRQVDCGSCEWHPMAGAVGVQPRDACHSFNIATELNSTALLLDTNVAMRSLIAIQHLEHVV